MDLFDMTETQYCKNKAFRRLAVYLINTDNSHQESLKQLTCIVLYRTGGAKMNIQEEIINGGKGGKKYRQKSWKGEK
jgi:hypothetical protein